MTLGVVVLGEALHYHLAEEGILNGMLGSV